MSLKSTACYHGKLQKQAGYLGRPFLWAYTTWHYACHGYFELTERKTMKELPLIVVGKVSEERCLLDPLSIVESFDPHGKVIEMDLEFRLQEPNGDVRFQKDYGLAWDTLKLLLNSPAIYSESSPFTSVFRHCSVRLETGLMSFVVPLFQRKSPWSDEINNVYSTGLTSNKPVLSHRLQRIQRDYEMTTLKVVREDRSVVPPIDYHQIAGKTVEVTFAMREKAETKMKSVEILTIVVLDAQRLH